MKKEEIIKSLNNQLKGKIPSTILSLLNDSLIDDVIYHVESSNNIFKIYTNIKEGEIGSYSEIVCSYDAMNKNISLVITTKEYSPEYQRRHIVEEVGLNIFTQSSSYVYDQTERLLHKSGFSDENKYYGNGRMPLDYSEEALLGYFQDTTPEYKNGYFVSGPKSSYQPITNIWQRYGDTNVVRKFGRNPIEGEYSNIAITFDDFSHDDIELLSESYGKFYVYGRQMKLSKQDEIVSTIEKIYQNSKSHVGFNLDKFYSEFEESMFEPIERKVK